MICLFFILARVCSIHFEADCFEISLRQRLLKYNPVNSRNLKSDAVPVLNLPHSSQKANNSERLIRLAKRTQRIMVADMLKEPIPVIQPQTSTSREIHEFEASIDKPMLVEITGTIGNDVNMQTSGERNDE